MNLGELLSDLYIAFDVQAAPATAVTTRFSGFLNKAHRAIIREPGLLRLRDTLSPLTFASVSGQAIYGLPNSLATIKAITERANNRDLDEMTVPELRANDPGLTSTGTPWAYVPLGYRPIQYVPASTGVWAASSSASDTTQTAQINGVRAAGLPTGDLQSTLTGTSRVAIGSTITDIVDLQTISISAVAVGIVSFYDAATNGNVLAQIPIGKTYPQYFCVQLYPAPTSAITYYVDGQLQILDMDDTQDVPMIPFEFHDLLLPYARMLEYERTGDDSRSQMARLEYQTGLSRLKYYISSMPSEIPVMGRPTTRRFSRFGPWAPATDWD